MAAVRAYADYRTENGSPGGTWLWIPVFGGSDQAYNFKVLNSHTNFEASGQFISMGGRKRCLPEVG